MVLGMTWATNLASSITTSMARDTLLWTGVLHLELGG